MSHSDPRKRGCAELKISKGERKKNSFFNTPFGAHRANFRAPFGAYLCHGARSVRMHGGRNATRLQVRVQSAACIQSPWLSGFRTCRSEKRNKSKRVMTRYRLSIWIFQSRNTRSHVFQIIESSARRSNRRSDPPR